MSHGSRELFMNEYMRIFEESDSIYIETYKKGPLMEQLNDFFTTHPEIRITNYTALRSAINLAPKAAQKFAEQKEKIFVSLENNNMLAKVIFYLPQEELNSLHRETLIRDTVAVLTQKGVVFGINTDVLKGELTAGKPYIVAEGIPPVHGNDSVIKMYELLDVKPDIRQDGKVDFYELKLINRVKIGDWLGERIEATEGAPGKTVMGEEIKPVKGKNFPLNYDKNTVQEIFDGKKTVLYSRINGAVNYANGKISVSNHLEIDGDVNPSTGNIKFEGYVTIRGTVEDGFSVEATHDIEINGDLGLGNFKEVKSTGGSIFIKGGIISKGRSEIHAAKNIYTKFVDNASITSGGSTHIGFYCINSFIQAKEVILDSPNGKIIGGQIHAQMRVMAPIIGSELEKKTCIQISGFDRKALLDEFDSVLRKISELKNEQQKLKQIIAAEEENKQMDAIRKNQYIKCLERIYELKEQIKHLEEERKNLANYLRTKGEGEITVTKKIYPNCILIMKKQTVEAPPNASAVSFYLMDGQLKQS